MYSKVNEGGGGWGVGRRGWGGSDTVTTFNTYDVNLM